MSYITDRFIPTWNVHTQYQQMVEEHEQDQWLHEQEVLGLPVDYPDCTTVSQVIACLKLDHAVSDLHAERDPR